MLAVRHDCWAAASAARSTGDEETGEEAATAAVCWILAAEVWAEDPEGAYTSALPSAAVLRPPEGEDWLEIG